jgi:ABC-type Na+ transport system ATPase subunit NatA
MLHQANVLLSHCTHGVVMSLHAFDRVLHQQTTVHNSGSHGSQKLASSGQLAFLGHSWRRSVPCAGGDMPMQGDISARQLIFNVPDVDPERRERLIQLLDINFEWRMHRVSDGQRRRVQICMGLLRPFSVLLLDEVCFTICRLLFVTGWYLVALHQANSCACATNTHVPCAAAIGMHPVVADGALPPPPRPPPFAYWGVRAQVTVDMDVLGRLELLRFFKRECEERGCIIVYATHIFDGLADWITHLAFLSDGRLVQGGPVADFPELQGKKLLHTATAWLREERERMHAKPKRAAQSVSKADLFGSRQMAFYR